MEYITQNSFSVVRLKMLFKRELISNRQQLLLKAAVLLGIIVVAEMFITWVFYKEWQRDSQFYSSYVQDASGQAVAVAWLFGLGLFTSLSASFVCSNLSTKPGRITSFMTVGTPLEKYLSRALIYTVGFFLLYIAGSVVVDLIRCLYIVVMTPATPHLFVYYLFKNVSFQTIYVTIAAILLEQAYFTIVSAFFPKMSFIKGICCAIVLTMVVSFVCAEIMPWFFDNYKINVEVLLYVFATGMLIFAAAMHLLAYYRYKETDIQ